MYTLRPYQQEAKQAILNSWDEGFRKTLLVLPTGCHAVGERLLMADGTVRAVENIAKGDHLLGADGKSRTVLCRHTGYDLLYRVTPENGESFLVTGDHKLTLVRNDKLTDVTVMEWLSWNEEKGQIVGKAIPTLTEAGQTVEKLAKSGFKICFSTRCSGKVKPYHGPLAEGVNNAVEVQPGLKIISIDVVGTPSCQKAVTNTVYEGFEEPVKKGRTFKEIFDSEF